MKVQKEEVIDVPNENLDSPKISQEKEEKDFYQKDDYPVDIKSNEHSTHSDESDDITDSSIQAAVRAGFVRKVYGILSIQLLITFGSVLLCQLSPIKKAIFSHQVLSGNLVLFSSLSFLVLFLCLACCRDLSRKVPYNYIFLFAITLCEAIACSIASSIHFMLAQQKQILVRTEWDFMFFSRNCSLLDLLLCCLEYQLCILFIRLE